MYGNVVSLDETGTAELVQIRHAATQRTAYAWITPDPDAPSWIRVQWLDHVTEPYRPSACDCWAWTESGVLWLPLDCHSNHQRDWNDDRPNRLDNWHDPETGLRAVFGIPGTTLSRMP